MTKTFVSVGKTSTESVDSDQPVWVLVPETRIPAVVSTYARQLQAGSKVLLALGNAQKIIEAHSLADSRRSQKQAANLNSDIAAAVHQHIDATAGDACKRTQLFLSFLSAQRLIRPPLYALVDKIHARSPLLRKDLTPLINALGAVLRKCGAAPLGYQRKLRSYIQNGSYDSESMLWLALAIDPIFALYLWHDNLASSLPDGTAKDRFLDQDRTAQDLHRAVDHIRAGIPCLDDACSADRHSWLAGLVGCEPKARFFATVETTHQGINKNGCLIFDRSKSFNDFGEAAPRFLTLDKLSRAVTALDRMLSHLAVAFADDDDEMKQLCQGHLVHSGLLIRGLLDENEAIRTLYPLHAVEIPNHPELTERLILKIREAQLDGSLANICANRYRLRPDHLAHGIARAISIQRQLMPLLPLEVHHLADTIETQVRLRRIAEKLNSSGDRRQASKIEAAIQAHTMRQQQLCKTIKADFNIDPARLFYIDEMLIDRIKALFGNELEFLRTVLAPYLERRKAATQAQSTSANPGLAINS